MTTKSDLFSNLQVKKLARRSRNSTLLGYGSVVVGQIAEVRFTIRKKKTSSDLCINWPAHRAGNGKFYTDVKFQSLDLKDELEDAILDAFDEAIEPEPTNEETETKE